MQAVMQVASEATATVVKAMTNAADLAEFSVERSAVGTSGPKAVGLHLKQPTFNWLAKDKYNELKTLK